MAASSDKPGSTAAKNPESDQISPLGQAIRYFRQEQRMTQEALAEATSEDEKQRVDKQRISDIERGATRTLHPATIMKLCDGLGITLDDLKAKEREFAKAIKAEDARKLVSRRDKGQFSIIHNEIRPVPGFTGREDLLASIDAALWQQGGTAALTNSGAHAAAVKGLGGVGKSVLAREYAWRARGRYRGVWWVRAETEQTLIEDLIEFGSRLIPNLKEVAERDRALHLALDAIAGAGGDKPWLIVYDNVEKPGAIAKLTPKTAAHILITSRWPRWQGHAQKLPVDVFPEDVAVDFLLAERPQETRQTGGRLAAALGLLPLALSHARAYCAETNLSFDDYARRLSELIQEAPEDAEYPASVFATFSLAIAEAADACPEARALMEIAAFPAPERIPLGFLKISTMLDERLCEKAITALFKVSLVAHNTAGGGERTISIHRIVQRVARVNLGRRLPAMWSLAFAVVRSKMNGVLPSAFEQCAMHLLECIIIGLEENLIDDANLIDKVRYQIEYSRGLDRYNALTEELFKMLDDSHVGLDASRVVYLLDEIIVVCEITVGQMDKITADVRKACKMILFWMREEGVTGAS